MCGIAAIIADSSRSYEANLHRMVKALRHRGPDASGAFFFENCALGHARLSIIDLSTGDQPMVDGSSSTGVTFNGEIYGYKSIKKELIDYPFRTQSDTEVILALYREFGTGMMPHLPGMFAFALWDDDKKSLFCARDRFGEKPLFFAFGRNGEFILASEIKALLASGLIDPVLSRRAITHYLQKLYVHPHETIYENIHTLPPAHMLEYTGGRLVVTRYWSLPTPREAIEFGEAVERFR